MTTGVDHVKIGDQRVPVMHLGPRGEVAPLVAQNAQELVVSSLNDLLRTTQSLVKVFDTWASLRVAGGRVDWAEIDAMLAVLLPRYPPQPEVTQAATGERRTRWLPGGYRTAALDTDALPPCDNTQAEAEGTYYSAQAVNCLDQVVTDRETARENPVLELGPWSNAVELATGLGYAILDCTESFLHRGADGEGLFSEITRKSLAIRRCIEEMKIASGTIDAISSPAGLGALGDFWETLVYGKEEDDPSALATVASDVVFGGVKNLALSWAVNRIEPVAASYTGLRTSSPLWITDTCRQGPISLLDREGYALQTGVGGAWYEGFFAQSGPFVESPILQRQLMRLDPLRVRVDEVVMCGRPDMLRSTDVSFRVDVGIFTLLGTSRGWQGQFRPQSPGTRPPPTTSWGLRTVVKDWGAGQFRTVVIASALVSVLQSSQISAETVWRYKMGDVPYIGTGVGYMFRRMGFGTRIGSGRKDFPEDGGDVVKEKGPEADTASRKEEVAAPPREALSGKKGASEERAEWNADHRERVDEA